MKIERRFRKRMISIVVIIAMLIMGSYSTAIVTANSSQKTKTATSIKDASKNTVKASTDNSREPTGLKQIAITSEEQAEYVEVYPMEFQMKQGDVSCRSQFLWLH